MSCRFDEVHCKKKCVKTTILGYLANSDNLKMGRFYTFVFTSIKELLFMISLVIFIPSKARIQSLSTTVYSMSLAPLPYFMAGLPAKVCILAYLCGALLPQHFLLATFQSDYSKFSMSVIL